MYLYYITFRSVTYAQRGEQVLRRGGFECALQRTPRWMEERGCGYSVNLRTKDIRGAVGLLRAEQIPFRKIYLRREDGSAEEAAV